MAYEVLARRWRPQQFDQVVGQSHVTQTLINAIKANRVAHAYLFVGPRGIGKTSTARILAKALNCHAGPTPTPCDRCPSCTEIMSGSSLDVLEIDAASNTGVENIRDIREAVRYTPARDRYKIYIIDEVHMLSTAAFNALLKTLEEPPPHVIFLFATTEPQKIPATVLSRCQRFDLRRISVRDLVKRLREIATAEGIEITDDALLAIARGAEGALRDAESALDQLIAFRGKTITEEDVLAVFGLAARQALDELIEGILTGDVARCIQKVAELDAAGKDLPRLVFDLLDQLREILVFQHAGRDVVGQELTEVQLATLERQAQLAPPGRVMRIVDILTEAESRIRYALSPRVLLETVLIRAARAATVMSLAEIMEELQQLRRMLTSGASSNPGAEQVVQPTSDPLTKSGNTPSPAIRKAAGAPTESGDTPIEGQEVQYLAEHWHELVERFGRAVPPSRIYLLDAKPVEVSGSRVVIGLDPEFAGNRDKLMLPRVLFALEKVLSEMLRRRIEIVEIRVLEAKDTVPGDIKVESLRRKAASNLSEPELKKAKKAKHEWMKDPTVQRTLEMFSGDIADIRE